MATPKRKAKRACPINVRCRVGARGRAHPVHIHGTRHTPHGTVQSRVKLSLLSPRPRTPRQTTLASAQRHKRSFILYHACSRPDWRGAHATIHIPQPLRPTEHRSRSPSTPKPNQHCFEGNPGAGYPYSSFRTVNRDTTSCPASSPCSSIVIGRIARPEGAVPAR